MALQIAGEDVQPGYAGWIVLELMGHRTRAGYLTIEPVAGVDFLRIDIPAEQGTRTEYYHPNSLYGMQPCDEATARHVADTVDMGGPVNRYALTEMVRAEQKEFIESLEERVNLAEQRFRKERDKVYALQNSQAVEEDDDEDEQRQIPF